MNQHFSKDVAKSETLLNNLVGAFDLEFDKVNLTTRRSKHTMFYPPTPLAVERVETTKVAWAYGA